MNQFSVLKKYGFTVLLILSLLSAFGGLYGCEKISLERPISENSFTEPLRIAFMKEGREKDLIQRVNDTMKIYWQPNWQAGYNKTSATGTVYTYVPLMPSLQSITSSRSHDNFNVFGVKRFILVTHSGTKPAFSLATYVANQQNQEGALKTKPSQSIIFSAFSGIMTLKGVV